MKIEGKEFNTIWFNETNHNVQIIDQTKLPHKFIIKDLNSIINMFTFRKIYKNKIKYQSFNRTYKCLSNNMEEFQKLKENITFKFELEKISIDNLGEKKINLLFQDGRVFSHFIENWLDNNCERLQKVNGCKNHDFIDIKTNIKYEQKTWTKNGLIFIPSNMIGSQRKININKFEYMTKKRKFIIVNNIQFPKIKIKFLDGCSLLKKYPSGITREKNTSFF